MSTTKKLHQASSTLASLKEQLSLFHSSAQFIITNLKE